jgi:hypothetical protein
MIRHKLNKLLITLFVVATFSVSVFATDGLQMVISDMVTELSILH